jgi:hypothetical protein
VLVIRDLMREFPVRRVLEIERDETPALIATVRQ